MNKTVRLPAAAGKFYPAEPARLRQMIKGFLQQVEVTGSHFHPRAIIVPHAGYLYSGPIAASAYASLIGSHDVIRRVLLLGPAHRVAVEGLAASSAEVFATPLGEVPVDQEATSRLLELPQVQLLDAAHSSEHGLEVHLPFLQIVLIEFLLIPLVVGEATPAEVAQVLSLFVDDPEVLLVISSDLSHYHDYTAACKLDRQTSQAIEALQPLKAGQACGRHAINGLLQVARQQGWQARTIDLRNSGDTAGSADQVVGYGAYLLL